MVSTNTSIAVQMWAAHTHTHLYLSVEMAMHSVITLSQCMDTSALNMGSVQLCIPSFLSRAFPELRAAPAPPRHHHTNGKDMGGCSQGNGIHAHSFLPSVAHHGFGW